jgi:hypothetical protein
MEATILTVIRKERITKTMKLWTNRCFQGGVLLLAACLCCGCQATRRACQDNGLPAAEDTILLDGFEGPEYTVWAFDAADDEAKASYVSAGATQGQKALRLTLQGKGAKGRLHLRRDVQLDLSRARTLLLDITAPSDKISAAFALLTGRDDFFQEAHYVALKAGLNKNVRFPLDAKCWKNSQTNWEYSGLPVNLKAVKRLMLLLYTNGESHGDILVDNLRVEGGPEVYREWRPEIVRATPIPAALPQYAGLEVEAVFRASYSDVFDSNDIAVGLHVQTPSGKEFDVPGFFAGLKQKGSLPDNSASAAPLPFWGPFKPTDRDLLPRQTDDTLPAWQVRFTPQETGRYELQLYVRNKAGDSRLARQSMLVEPAGGPALQAGRRGGNVQVSKRDSRQLELQAGSPFIIFGQNVCWTQNWAPYLEKIKAYGGNTCRIWLCPWGLNLESPANPGRYDLLEAERLDTLMAQAEETGVRIIFCFTFHGAVTDFWGQSPYNEINGGPCARPEDFFTSARARRQFQRLLAYAAARWGSSPALLAWELMNEIDLANWGSGEAAESWSREMAGYLKAADVHSHLVTLSVCNPLSLPELWSGPGLDFVSVHGYGPDVSQVVYDCLARFRTQSKPVLLAEFGGGWKPGDDIPDKNGARLRAALWLTACSPACGAALPWWWDTYLEAYQLYPVLAAPARFLAGEDRRGRFGEWVRKSWDNGVEVSGIMDGQGARLYVERPAWDRSPESRGGEFLKAPLRLELQGLLSGAYALEFWDAATGQVFAKATARADNARLEIELPAHPGEFAVKVDRNEILKPELK